MATIAYVRVSTDQQDVQNQKYEILEFGRKNALTVDEFIEVEMSSRKSQKSRRIDELLERLKPGDTLVVAEISRLGRSTTEVVGLVNELVRRKVAFIAIKQGLRINSGASLDMHSKVVVTMFSLFAEIERDIISERTKQALRAKRAAGVRLGKPKGTVQASKLDGRKDEIERLLKHRVPVAALARVLGCSRTALNHFLDTRNLRGGGTR